MNTSLEYIYATIRFMRTGIINPSRVFTVGMVTIFLGAAFLMRAVAADTPVLTDFPLGETNFDLYKILDNRNGGMWVTSYRKLWRVATDGGSTEVPLPYMEFGGGEQMVSDPDGNLWMGLVDCGNPTPEGSCYQDKIGRMTPEGGVTEYSLGTGFVALRGIAVGPDGTVWFMACEMENFACKNGSYTFGKIPPGGALTQSEVLGIADGDKLTYGPDGNLWFVEIVGGYDPGYTYKFGKLTQSGVLTYVTAPQPADGRDVTKLIPGPDGNIWFVERVTGSAPLNHYGTYTIGKLTPAGLITKYAVPDNNGEIADITLGPDGNLWFILSDRYANINRKIGWITPDGVITEYAYPSEEGGDGGSITAGPDGNLWFVQGSVSKIFRLNLTGSVLPTSTPTATPTSPPVNTPTPKPTKKPKPTPKPKKTTPTPTPIQSGSIMGSSGNLYWCTNSSSLCTSAFGEFSAGTNLTMVCWRDDRNGNEGPYVTNRWFYVKLADGREGFVNASHVNHQVPTPNCSTVKEIAASLWATDRIDQELNVGLCLQFVRDAYASIPFDIGNPTGKNVSAVQWWNAHNKLQVPGDTKPPRGALVFWNGYKGYEDGHVAISLGNGYTMSTAERESITKTKNIHLMSIDERNNSYTAIGTKFSTLYLGHIIPKSP